MALPDKAYLPLAQDSAGIGQLFELLKNSMADKHDINAILELGKPHEKGVKIIRKAIISDKTPLTLREREIADRGYVEKINLLYSVSWQIIFVYSISILYFNNSYVYNSLKQ